MRVDAAVGRAGADGEDRQRLRREAVDPVVDGHRLAGVGVVAEPRPVAVAVDLLVGDRALDDEHERIELAAVGLEEPLQEVVGAAVRPALEVDQRPVDGDLGQARAGRRGRSLRSLGCVAAVSATESPSQLRPALIQRTWTTSSSGGASVAVTLTPFRPWAPTMLGARNDRCRGSPKAPDVAPVLRLVRQIVNECVFATTSAERPRDGLSCPGSTRLSAPRRSP